MSILGIILILLAGFSQGTFGLGMKHQKPLSWAHFWLIYTFFGMLIIPILWGVFSTSAFWPILLATPHEVIFKAIGLGFLWGIGGILFGKSVEYVGISITNGVVMGLAGGLGAIIPLMGIPGVSSSPSFIWVIVGVAMMLVGVGFSAYAGIIRDKESHLSSPPSDTTARVSGIASQGSTIGLLIVILAGVLSSLLNVGFEAANPMVKIATDMGVSTSAAGLPARAIVVFGGFLMNAGYALYILLTSKNNQVSTDTISEPQATVKANLWAIFTGLLWFLPLGLSGIVAARIGVLGNTITWPVMLSLSLVFGNVWGYMTDEWKGAQKAFMWMIASSVILIVSCLILTFKDLL